MTLYRWTGADGQVFPFLVHPDSGETLVLNAGDVVELADDPQVLHLAAEGPNSLGAPEQPFGHEATPAPSGPDAFALGGSEMAATATMSAQAAPAAPDGAEAAPEELHQ